VHNRILRAGIDALQLQNCVRTLVEGNEITGVRRFDPRSHSDVLQTLYGGQDLTIRGNLIHDNEAGMLLSGGPVRGVVLENNVITRTRAQWPVMITDATNVRIVHNTVWANDLGVIIRGDVRGAEVLNNIMNTFKVEAPATLGFLDYNYVPAFESDKAAAMLRTGVSTAPASSALRLSAIAARTNAALEEPLRSGRPTYSSLPTPAPARARLRRKQDLGRGLAFVNANGLDFRLAPGSAGIDAGLGGAGPSRDLYGRPRRDQTSVRDRGAGVPRHVDLGAVETQPFPAHRDGRRRRPGPRVRLRSIGVDLGSSGALTFDAQCATRCTLRIGATVEGPRGSIEVPSVAYSLEARRSRAVTLKLARAAAGRLRRLLNGCGGRASVRFRAFDLDGRDRGGHTTVPVR